MVTSRVSMRHWFRGPRSQKRDLGHPSRFSCDFDLCMGLSPYSVVSRVAVFRVSEYGVAFVHQRGVKDRGGVEIEKPAWVSPGGLLVNAGNHACSTIGPARLNFRVRDGNGCDPRGMVTGKSRCAAKTYSSSRVLRQP